MVNAKVLVLEAPGDRAQALEVVLRFLDLEPVPVSDPKAIRGLAGSMPNWLATIVSESVFAAHASELIGSLRALDQPPAILYLSSGGLPDAAALHADLPWMHLESPVRQRQLTTLIAQAERLQTGRAGEHEPKRFRPSGQSHPMREIRYLIEQVAPSDSNVLILGESGTGKEVVARHLHELSHRAKQPFVPVNCGAIPAELLESELFGHEKGAFTGALSTRLGRFEFAEGGTLFLDEIGDMSLQMQVKLLRVLQERSFERVGSNRTIRCDVRIIAATHRDLEAAIAAGRFREDLFYRLNVFPIQIPPLRERLPDLPILIEHLLDRQIKTGGPRLRLAPDALDCLMRCPWPGNVRELANLLERLTILHKHRTIAAIDLPERYRAAAGMSSAMPAGSATPTISDPLPADEPDSVRPDAPRSDVAWPDPAPSLPRGGLDLKDHLSAIELGLIRKALQEADGTVAVAARLLRMRRTTLVEKLRKYRLYA